MSEFSGDMDSFHEYYDMISDFLSPSAELYQRAIQTIDRLKSGSLTPKETFKFWLNMESSKVVAFAYKLDTHPVFIAFSENTNNEFLKNLCRVHVEFQGVVCDLDPLVCQSFNIKRDKLLFQCTVNTLKPIERENDNFLFRVADKNDEQQLTEMLDQFSLAVNLPPNMFSSVRDMMSRGRIYVACPILNPSKVVSCAYITNPACQVSRVTFVYTKKDFRRRGISQNLISKILHECLAHDLSATLFVDANNQSAISTYKSVGFMEIASYQVRTLNH